MKMDNTILQLFPAESREFWKYTASCQAGLREIRLRAGRPILVYVDDRELFLDDSGRFTDNAGEARTVKAGELSVLLEHICHYSLYAFEDELRQGFLTVAGGHRIGIAGQVTSEDGTSIRTVRNISFLNIRVSHEIRGAADAVMGRMYSENGLKSALIISPPGCGKTTLLRDLIRQVSDGSAASRGMTVGVVDERSEIAGTFCGIPQNDVGMRTDVLDACPKRIGMMMLLRSMAPEVIAIDELGSSEELEALRCASASGCRILATVHGESMRDVADRFGGQDKIWGQLFQTIVLLAKRDGKCVVKEIRDGGVELCLGRLARS